MKHFNFFLGVLTFFSFLFLLYSCGKMKSQYLDDYHPFNDVELSHLVDDQKPFNNTMSLIIEDTLYYSPLQCYIIEKEDPYELTNINSRLKTLSNRSITSRRDIIMDYSPKKATHYAIEIKPSSPAEYEMYVNDPELMVSPIPFGYSFVSYISDPGDDLFTAELSTSIDLDDEQLCCTGDVEMAAQKSLSPLFITWPVSKPLPDKYTFYYDIYIPDRDIDTDILLMASIAGFVDGSSNMSSIDFDGIERLINETWTGRITVYDETLGAYVPLRNVSVTLLYAASTTLLSTDDDGYLSFPTTYGSSTRLMISLQNDLYGIYDGSTCRSFILGTIESYKDSQSPYCYSFSVNLPYNFYYHVYQAARYYFYASNSLLNIVDKIDDVLSTRFHINALPTSGSNFGCFRWNAVPPYIDVWNYCPSYLYRASYIFGTVLHELGHATHYATVGNTEMHKANWDVIESFASFFGWYNVKTYYSSILTTSLTVNDICHQGRQEWQYTTPDSTSHYTPFYVDMNDSFNQHTSSMSSNVNDCIQYVPLYIILNSAIWKRNLQSSYEFLCGYDGYYLSKSSLDLMANYYPGIINIL